MNKQLLDEMQNAVKETVSDKKIGVAFSGGVDSTLLAKLVKDMGYDIHLLTIGFQDSHDINFAKEVNQKLSYKNSISEIDPEKFKEVSDKIHQLIKTDNLSWNENSIAFYYVAKLAQKKDALLIGSSDFTHYEENEFAHRQDLALIEPILKLDVDEFYKILYERNVTACGFGAIASTMVACKELGATEGKLLKYATSGDISGDKSSVVGYASIIFV